MAKQSSRSFWSDFVAGLAGPAAYKSRRPRKSSPAGISREQEEEALDAFDTLTNLRDTDFWFDEDYTPVVRQLESFHRLGYVTTSPELLRDGANIGNGVLLTPAGRDALDAGRAIVDAKLNGQD